MSVLPRAPALISIPVSKYCDPLTEPCHTIPEPYLTPSYAVLGGNDTGKLLKIASKFAYQYAPDAAHEEGWKTAFYNWYITIPNGAIIAPISSPGNGLLVGWKSQSTKNYGAFLWIGDGIKRFLYIDISSDVVTTNF